MKQFHFLHKNLNLSDYILKFRDAPKFIEYCKKCSNYTSTWHCPPFDYSTDDLLARYKEIRLYVFPIKMPHASMEAKDGMIYFSSLLPEIHFFLLNEEKKLAGRVFSFAGKCMLCHERCARLDNAPCRHPDMQRPSLEAFGFDLEKTLSSLFQVKMQWGEGGKFPHIVHFIGAVVY